MQQLRANQRPVPGPCPADVVTPPRILREDIPINARDSTGVALLDEMLGVWFSWYDEDGGAPDWSRFRPFDRPSLLPHIILLEQIGDRYRCAIIGEEAVRGMCIKLGGRFLDDAMPPENLANILTRFDKTLAMGLPNFVEKTKPWHPGQDLMTYRGLQLPFGDRHGDKPRILCVMNFTSERV